MDFFKCTDIVVYKDVITTYSIAKILCEIDSGDYNEIKKATKQEICKYYLRPEKTDNE
mgnify:CR=1 FL=1